MPYILPCFLTAYQNLLRKHPQYRATKLDAALAAQTQGTLATFINTLSGREAALTWSPSSSADPVVKRIVALGMSEPCAMDWLLAATLSDLKPAQGPWPNLDLRIHSLQR